MNYLKYQLLRNLVLIGLEQFHWIDQKTIGSQSHEFLKYTFPKTFERATFNLACQIACLDHDKHIQGNKIHLFRFSQNDEQQLSSIPIDLADKDIIIGLTQLASNIAIEGSVGPIHIGSDIELNEDFILQSFAKHYLEAFKNNYKTYPYLS
jgi:hypothetical protein